MNPERPSRLPSRLLLAGLALVVLFATGFAVVGANVLGMGDRFERLTARIENFIDPPPQRSTLPTVVVTPAPTPSPTPDPTFEPSQAPSASPTPM